MAGRRRASSGRTSLARPVNQPLTYAGPSSRAARAAERRKQRRIRLVAGSAVLVLVAAAAIVLVLNSDRSRRAQEPPAVRTQRTLLFQLSGADRSASAAALFAFDPTPKTAAIVLVPPHVVAEVPGFGSLPFGNALRLGGPASSRDAVGDLVGVIVDHDWTLDPGTFARLIDALGGVTVDLDRDFVVPGSQRGTTVLIAREGPNQRLDGTTAARWASYVASGENQLAAQPRLQSVLTGMLDAMPDEPSGFARALTSLGSGSRSSLTPAALATYLDGARDVDATGELEAAILPVNTLDVGGRTTSYSIKQDEVSALVQRTMAASVPPGRLSGTNRVLVQNGVGTPGIGQSVARKLNPRGFDIVATRNAPHFGYRQSVVLVFDGTDESRARGARVAQLLGLPGSSVKVATLTQSVADVIVIIGADYKP